MNELEILISELKRELDILSSLPYCQIHESKKQELETCEKALEILEQYRVDLVEGGLI